MSSPMSALPEYSDTSPPPFYSVQVSDGEELLAATGAPPLSTRTGSYTQRWDCGLEVILSEQTPSLASNDPPVYHQQGLICGKIIFRKNTESILQVFLKIEGKLKLGVSGKLNSGTSTIKLIDECYKLWTKSRSQAGTSTSESISLHELDFSSVLPARFKDRESELLLPPSHEISLTGIPGLQSQCTYAIQVLVVSRSSLWSKTKTYTIPFKYIPRHRPAVPLVTNDGIRPECPLFHATIKSAPEFWFEANSVLKPKPTSGLSPIEAQLFIPSGRTFGLRDEIPFHIQLTGTASSLQALYSRLELENVTDSSPSSPTLTIHSTTSSGAMSSSRGKNKQKHKVDNNNLISLSVTLHRQVRIEVKEQVVWKSFIIGEGRIHPIPPPFDAECYAGNERSFVPSPAAEEDPERIENLDGAGGIRCRSDIEVGHFNVKGRVQVKEFLVLEFGSLKQGPRSDIGSAPFFPLRMAVPVLLVTDSWSEHPMMV